jgi:glutamate 5-kinase
MTCDEAQLIAGRNSREIEAIVGYPGRAEMIHRDDLVLEDAHSERTG